MSYRMEMHDADVLVGDDPFNGLGVFLPSGLPDAYQILDRINAAFGMIPAVAYPSKGAWVNPADSGLGKDEVKDCWSGMP